MFWSKDLKNLFWWFHHEICMRTPERNKKQQQMMEYDAKFRDRTMIKVFRAACAPLGTLGWRCRRRCCCVESTSCTCTVRHHGLTLQSAEWWGRKTARYYTHPHPHVRFYLSFFFCSCVFVLVCVCVCTLHLWMPLWSVDGCVGVCGWICVQERADWGGWMCCRGGFFLGL